MLTCSRRRFCELSQGLPEIGSSQLAKEIWKCSKRSIRSPGIWSNLSKQVVSNSPFLTPRDVSVVIQSFARVGYKDTKMISAIVPSILKHATEFSVRELVTILSSFRKLELDKSSSQVFPSSCINLLVNEISLRSSEWTPIDVPLIANSIAWFSVFDDHVWKKIGSKTLKMVQSISPLGLSLIVSSYAKVDKRDERVLAAISRVFIRPITAHTEAMKQESLAVLINGFAKLDWNSKSLFEYIETELLEILRQIGPNFFDNQSKIMILHAFFAHRFRYLETVSETQVWMFESLVDSILASRDTLSSDQREKLTQIVATGNRFEEIRGSVRRIQTLLVDSEGPKTFQKLARWEYEVFRILRDKMEVKVKKKRIANFSVMTFDSPQNNCLVVLNCLGPFQHYMGSTKRTSASWIRREVIRWELERSLNRQVRFIELPFYIWNELKTDKDKIMFLMARGRQVANNEDSDEVS